MSAPQTTAVPKCPHCGNSLSFDLVASFQAESRMTLSVSPKKGEMLSAAHIGGVIQSFAKLLNALGKDAGFKTTTAVEKISTREDGTIDVDVLIARNEPTLLPSRAAAA